ncbi:FAD-dependent monooxygenase [Amycolatopsis sp. PS_44_ISF1]|uniref:FAD-dependent monooxygenase n=1 Tax=Amycolatopsis sp. PS_44_ISF1 TaxID=2974917 RepID=UPI0028DFBE44|nr:FAD-dependent monooxygenase [Amycolatopsis sp. PS_44_ISF1]MDT8911838.1 FAD-dependent monooxygenase [Amycolatopsis sp. PS_44_ISF1]
MSTIDVVIAGGGPTGLMLACELSLAGARPVVLERLTERSGDFRANGLVGQVVRLLHRRGLYERLSVSEAPAPAPRYVFGAFPLDLAEVPDNPLYILPLPQRELERALEERALELGVEIRRGHEVTGLDPETGEIDVRGPGGPYRLQARFVAGADGGRSTVRKLAGIGFPGVTHENQVSRTASVSLPDSVRDPETGGLRLEGVGVIRPFAHFRTETGLFAFAPFDPANPGVMTSERDRPAPGDEVPVTLEEVRESIRRVLGTDLPISPPTGPGPHQLRRVISGNTRLAETFRRGRVLLVGDAAHVHSAIGGPGLNLGLQDVANLAWKLAAEVHGWAPPGLLDSYEAERRPVSRRVVMHTEAQGVLTAPGPEVTALRELFGELLGHPDVVAHLAALMAGSDVRYGEDPHPLTGRWAPDLQLDEQDRLTEAAHAARPILLDLTADAATAAVAAPWRDRVDTITTTASGEAPTAVLIRPDGYVAWASSDEKPDPDALREALARWFGPEAGATA